MSDYKVCGCRNIIDLAGKRDYLYQDGIYYCADCLGLKMDEDEKQIIKETKKKCAEAAMQFKNKCVEVKLEPMRISVFVNWEKLNKAIMEAE